MPGGTHVSYHLLTEERKRTIRIEIIGILWITENLAY